MGVDKIHVGVVTKEGDRFSNCNFFTFFLAILLQRDYHGKDLSCNKVVCNLQLFRFGVFMEFRRVTSTPYQCYRHSTTRLLTRGNLLTEISFIMIVDVSGHHYLSLGGSTVTDGSLFCFLLIIELQQTLLQQG